MEQARHDVEQEPARLERRMSRFAGDRAAGPARRCRGAAATPMARPA